MTRGDLSRTRQNAIYYYLYNILGLRTDISQTAITGFLTVIFKFYNHVSAFKKDSLHDPLFNHVVSIVKI